jgi:hypothetical protein
MAEAASDARPKPRRIMQRLRNTPVKNDFKVGFHLFFVLLPKSTKTIAYLQNS